MHDEGGHGDKLRDLARGDSRKRHRADRQRWVDPIPSSSSRPTSSPVAPSPGQDAELPSPIVHSTSAASGPLLSLQQNLRLMHSVAAAAAAASASSRSGAGQVAGNVPILPLPPGQQSPGMFMSAPAPNTRKKPTPPSPAPIVPLLPRPLHPLDGSGYRHRHPHLQSHMQPSSAQTQPQRSSGGYQQHQPQQQLQLHQPPQQQPQPASQASPGVAGTPSSSGALPQPLEVRSVSVGPQGVGLTLNDNRVIQLQRAEDLTPLYAHALAQLRAACDLLIVRDREVAVLRAAAASSSSPSTIAPMPDASAPVVVDLINIEDDADHTA
ncbi:uncharacterized protein ACA1_064380 [Acanthamoeba castellanii str. Neff]|uniref:Uncharacterized protein n=1 Tax=Acanthamoeba castellanii (strain ATCC 30010 / Neff) TaxID=1257118 RepID=L8GYQ3_ACACF|nr:uncharacterized protein ACA1_064380 [Acanthamoeba castellanii str. Neff]ELR17653.1 hypothetical protein ACA1_064380 [Acanthamoeba castellanii str. Neff]